MDTTHTDTSMKGNSGAHDYASTVQKLRDQADAVVQRIQPQISAVSTYARDEPTKALLISAATGAALMGLVALMVRSGGGGYRAAATHHATKAGTSAMSAIRDAALDLADRAQSMASDALHSAQQRIADTIDSGRDRAASTADRVRKSAADGADATSETMSETVAEAWRKVRDQAAPVVDKIRPQIDAATAYAKDDPARAALGLAAAGAIIAGLFALARQAGSDSSNDTYPY